VAERPKQRFPNSAASTVVAMPAARVGAHERAYLVILAGPQMGEMVKLEPGAQITVGREEGVQLLLNDDGVSRQHARLNMVGGQVLLTDLGSRNGTFVNGEKVVERRLSDGDKIQIGVATTLKFTYTDDLEEEYQRRLVEAALRDPLTGVYNRRHFDERLAAEFAAARRHGTPLSLLVVDVDHFKQVNDTNGHLAGDALLKVVARALADGLRKEDILARYGGEEFVVIARGTDLAGGTQFAERLRERIEQAHCNWEGKQLRVTASIGLAQLGAEMTVQQLIDAADRGVYQAKRNGRNQVCATATA
jgi:two-component system, cell cycle response regulator